MAGFRFVASVALLLIVISFFWLIGTHPMKSNTNRTVDIAGISVRVYVANTEVLREQGLSGRDGLAPDQGMLFVFDMPGTYGFWMKDMRFPIDIVWLDAAGKVITIKADALPSSYPEVFLPSGEASYVLELPAGFAAAHHLAEGDRAAL